MEAIQQISEIPKIVIAIGQFIMFAVIIIYGLAFYWDLKYIIKNRKTKNVSLKIYCASVALIFVGIYVYLLVKSLLGFSEDITFFGTVVVRPAILLMGGAMASNALADTNR